MPIDQAAALQLCLLTTECQRCEGLGYLSYNPNLNPNSFPGIATAECSAQCTVGRVYLLDSNGEFGLRAECPCLYLLAEKVEQINHWLSKDGCNACWTEQEPHKHCQNCQGRCWIPSTDSWAYVQAAWEANQEAEYVQYETFRLKVLQAIEIDLDNPQNLGETAFEAVKEALLKGVKL
ncbi:MAG: hypothetical protein HY376_03565 [Candidatus Blackburnbacteria bacterium]|nr:hypothetical protein [Candidatus Blackburnbacteria bacterium]